MKFDAYQMVTDKICELLEQGYIPWEKPWASVESCGWSGSDGHAYSLLNQFLLADPKKKYASISELFADVAGEWVTFKQALDRGGCVRKGETGRKVVFYTLIEKKSNDLDKDAEKEYFPYLTAYTVFKVSQCDGIKQKFHLDSGKLYDFNEDKTAEEVAGDYISREGIKLLHVHGERASYSPELDRITLPVKEQFQNNAEYYSTLFHEMTHSTGHPNRLNRIVKTAAFGDDDYSVEELTAEIGSASLMATLGVENALTMRNNAGYVQHWLKALKNDKKMIVVASARAEKAIKMILNIGEGK